MTKYSLYNPLWQQKGYYPKIVAYYYREWNDYHMLPHTHDQIEIMYVIQGKCRIDTTKESLHLAKGDFILLDADTSHSLIVDAEGCRMLNVEFIFEKKEETLVSFAQLITQTSSLKSLLKCREPYILLKDMEEIYRLLRRVIRELDEKGEDHDEMVHFYMAQIFISIGRLMKERRDQELAAISQYVKKAIRFMNDHYDADLRVEEIASSINIHPGYFHRIFKEYTGVTPMDYLMQIRMGKAEMLLTYTDMSVIDIAAQIGMNSRQYFSYVFKQHSGVSPMQFRKKVDKFERDAGSLRNR